MEVKRSSASRAPTHNEYNELPASSKPHSKHVMLLIYTAHSKDIWRNFDVNSYEQHFHGDWITSVRACTSDREPSTRTRTSKTRMNRYSFNVNAALVLADNSLFLANQVDINTEN